MSLTDDRVDSAEATVSHWDAAYAAHGADAVSWFQESPEVSLELIDSLALSPTAPVVDVGGGASRLADTLLERGFTDVTVLDVSSIALEFVRERLGNRPGLQLVQADLREWEPHCQVGLWHDRAVFHFLVDPAERVRYLSTLRAAVAPGGAVVVATFAEDGPDRCSGRPVARYSAATLAQALGPTFELVESRRDVHITPRGARQPFTWVAGRMQALPDRDEPLRTLVGGATARIRRLDVAEARAAVAGGTVLIDIRSAHDRDRDGIVPGSVHIPRTVLEWRLAPDSAWRTLHLAPGSPVLVLCDHGYASALAATLVELGYLDAGDVVGGFQAWREAGLPIARPNDHTLAPGELPGMRGPELGG
jgi:rhodanese-related sulfurtransferase